MSESTLVKFPHCWKSRVAAHITISFKADFHKCPLFIPNGDLEPHCGPATDWLCQFSCNNGFNKHTYMWGRLKWFHDKDFNLLCQDGVWKTGYEDIGLEVSGVCVPKGMHVYKAYITMPRSRWGGGDDSSDHAVGPLFSGYG